MKLIDCHTHLHDFEETEISEIIHRAKLANVAAIITAGTTIESSANAINLSKSYDHVFPGVGIHPNELNESFSEKTTTQILELASNDEVIMISEIGLEFRENSPDRAVQYKAFRRQIGIARELSLPIVFHCRGAYEDTIRVLKEERAFEVGGAMHYFQADQIIANQLIDLGFYVSLGRPLSRIDELQEVTLNIPINRILIETDSFPQPFKKYRENWTEPRHTLDVANEISCIKNIDIEEVASITSHNTLQMLKNPIKLKHHFDSVFHYSGT
ncbi:MAG: hypothetical protein CL904_03810 [Dehalococcoidia bacterium]|nr:hypothetical protein [Dehalococcoidia bacterium]MQG15829.1 TatD family deoxyribonuclease [SAR202 cluster bacterium]|tara:strand:+ start:18387 stop:19199 length:813 start_codon:yes stop_codon:yes gene_type:complete